MNNKIKQIPDNNNGQNNNDNKSRKQKDETFLIIKKRISHSTSSNTITSLQAKEIRSLEK